MCDWAAAKESSDKDKLKEMYIESCVWKTVRDMTSEAKCVPHVGEYASVAGASTATCSLQDLEDRCVSVKGKFTVQDARELCSAKHDAEQDWWMKNSDRFK